MYVCVCVYVCVYFAPRSTLALDCCALFCLIMIGPCCQVISYRTGNDYVMATESMLYDVDRDSMLNTVGHDEIWTFPAFFKSVCLFLCFSLSLSLCVPLSLFSTPFQSVCVCMCVRVCGVCLAACFPFVLLIAFVPAVRWKQERCFPQDDLPCGRARTAVCVEPVFL